MEGGAVASGPGQWLDDDGQFRAFRGQDPGNHRDQGLAGAFTILGGDQLPDGLDGLTVPGQPPGGGLVQLRFGGGLLCAEAVLQ